jgi:hypothetical protein
MRLYIVEDSLVEVEVEVQGKGAGAGAGAGGEVERTSVLAPDVANLPTAGVSSPTCT